LKNLTPLVPPFKVTQGHRNRCGSITYDFLLTFRSNYGPTLYRFREKRRFHSKIATFFTPPVYWRSPLKGLPLELGTGSWCRKTRMMGLPGRERSLTISSAVWIQYMNVTDRQTDGRTDSGRQQIPRLRMTSCSNDVDICWLKGVRLSRMCHRCGDCGRWTNLNAMQWRQHAFFAAIVVRFRKNTSRAGLDSYMCLFLSVIWPGVLLRYLVTGFFFWSLLLRTYMITHHLV